MMWQAAVAVCLISLAVVIYLIVTAPEGYEDETGFHYGKPDDSKKGK